MYENLMFWISFILETRSSSCALFSSEIWDKKRLISWTSSAVCEIFFITTNVVMNDVNPYRTYDSSVIVMLGQSDSLGKGICLLGSDCVVRCRIIEQPKTEPEYCSFFV